MEILLFSCFLVSFLVTFLMTPKWIRKTRAMGLVGKDMNKPGKPDVPEAGGITVIVGAVLGILLYVFISTFYFSSSAHMIEIFALVTTILMAGFVGFIDDIIGWKSGISQRFKVALTIPIAVPLAVVNAGHSIMHLPFFGPVDLGFLFPLVIIPAGVIGATNGFNMLAGYNGLETGMGIIIMSALGLLAWISGSAWVSMLALCMISALLAFFRYNGPPAAIFPGDSLTYAVGATVAGIAILGNMEKLVLVLFAPYFFDMLMFLRFRLGGMREIEAFAKVKRDGSLELPYRKIYDFTHLALWLVRKVKAKAYEKDVLFAILLVETALTTGALLLISAGLL